MARIFKRVLPWGFYTFLLLGGGLGACAGDRTAQSWFAPDPQLLEEQAPPSPTPPSSNPTPSPTSTPSPTPQTAETRLTLPPNFPADLPRYPQAQLLRSTYQLGQGNGETQWEIGSTPAQIAQFYQEVLTGKGWRVTEPFRSDAPQLTLTEGETTVSITFPEANRFLIRYQMPPNPTASPSQPSPEMAQKTSIWAQDLITLGTIPADLALNETIPRRTFARWLFETYNRFYADRPTQQIRPAAAVSVPLFSDVPASHPDFPMIQGLAEAGVIPSRLNGGTQTLFQPDAPLTREMLIQWKVPLDRRGTFPAGTLAAVKETWGFQDGDQIEPQTFAPLLVDYDNGDRANLRRAFGYTKLFQPKRPVTQGEAAAALWFFGFQGEGMTAAEVIAPSNNP